MKNKISKILIKGTIVLILGLTVSTFVYALDDYTVLAPLPGTTKCNDGQTPTAVKIDNSGKVSGGCTTTFEKYLPGMFKFAIGVSAVLAFIMITFGGLMYMTTEAVGGKGKAKEYITNAIWGLVLVISSWVLLNTINPQLLKFDLNIITPQTQTQDTITTLDASQLATNSAIGSALQSMGIASKSTAVLVGLKDPVFVGLKKLSAGAGCKTDNTSQTSCVNVTQGVEGSHTSLLGDKAGTAVDISANPKINDVITNNWKTPPHYYNATDQANDRCRLYTYGGGEYLFEKQGDLCGGKTPSKGATHWHATYK